MSNRTALVTGATRNIGAGIATRLAAAGYAVGVNGRDPQTVEETTAALRRSGARAVAVPGDISDEATVAAVVDRLCAEFGSVDVLVNNAGIRHHAPVTETELADWTGVLTTVLNGAFLLTRAVLPGMYEAGWGRIVNVAGVSGQMGVANSASVVTAKSGLIGLTKAISMEAAPRGVTVNAISPALIDTQRAPVGGDAQGAAAGYQRLATDIPVGRLGTVSEVAGLCAYLCSDEAGFVTGQVYAINGGLYR